MVYNKHSWESQELITAEKLNNIENGIVWVDGLAKFKPPFGDALGDYNTPIEVSYPLLDVFSGIFAIFTVDGGRVDLNIGGNLKPSTVIGTGDIVIGKVPEGVPLPKSIARGSIVNISANRPGCTIRIALNGNITVNHADGYTSGSMEFVEGGLSYRANTEFTPFKNSEYIDPITVFSGTTIQGVVSSHNHYFFITSDSNFVDYDVANKTTNVVSFPEPVKIGHGNDLCIILDNYDSTGKIIFGSSAISPVGVPKFEYDSVNKTIVHGGVISVLDSSGNSLPIASSQVSGSELIVTGNGKYWKVSGINLDLNTSEDKTGSLLGNFFISNDEYESFFGKYFVTNVVTGQADYVNGSKAYKIKNSMAISIVLELDYENGIDPEYTGRYWCLNDKRYTMNEIEKVWVENNRLMCNANIISGTVTKSIVATLDYNLEETV